MYAIKIKLPYKNNYFVLFLLLEHVIVWLIKEALQRFTLMLLSSTNYITVMCLSCLPCHTSFVSFISLT